MSITSLFGKNLIVDYPLLKGLRIDLSPEKYPQALIVEGTIMESAKVFDHLKIVRRDNIILLSVFASLPVWKPEKTPDFKENKAVDLPPGSYNIFYLGRQRKTTLIKTIKVVR